MRSWWVRHRSHRVERPDAPDDPLFVPQFVGLPCSDLADRLRLMRGNITTPMPAGAGGAQRVDQVVILSRAARDHRWIERTNEDAVLSAVTEYRSIDDPARRRGS
ncbi:MAG: hypothetical protein CL424_15970 [Acidimicrobiaceae bacterium]|nr:hypothetical protein [Acidimicrobiaceae bacterium]